MRLIGLKIDENSLSVNFMRKSNEKRETDVCYQELYKDMYFDITDSDKIGEIMDYFVKNCDKDTSPQSLWSYKGVNYKTLIKDYKENSDFDEVLEYIAKILGVSLSDEDRSYIASIEVSYPETWEVQII